MGVIILNKKKKKTLPPYGTVGTVPDPDLNRYGSTHAPPGKKLSSGLYSFSCGPHSWKKTNNKGQFFKYIQQCLTFQFPYTVVPTFLDYSFIPKRNLKNCGSDSRQWYSQPAIQFHTTWCKNIYPGRLLPSIHPYVPIIQARHSTISDNQEPWFCPRVPA